jgi:hypothetical protein
MRNEHLENEDSSTEALALALGWFSVALGTAELVAPRQLARLIGVPAHDRNANLLRTFGAREVASGIGILTRRDKAKWLWSRVGGDALDLAALGAASTEFSSQPRRLAIAAAAVAGVTALDVQCARRLSEDAATGWLDEWSPDKETAITVRITIERAEAQWIAWCATHASDMKDLVVARFQPAPGARGTEIHVNASGQKIRSMLRRFKQVAETGEIPVSDGPGLWRPARPADDPDKVKQLAGVKS